MQKRVTFRNLWLPYLLLAPQVIVTLVFFIWPASQALFQSMLVEDPFGLRSEFVWFENFEELFADPLYFESLTITTVFSVSTTLLALSSGLLLAGDGRPGDQGRGGLQGRAAVALRGGPGGGRGACGFSCSARRTASSRRRSGSWATSGTTCSTAARPCCW